MFEKGDIVTVVDRPGVIHGYKVGTVCVVEASSKGFCDLLSINTPRAFRQSLKHQQVVRGGLNNKSASHLLSKNYSRGKSR
jgi:hypothetical protein